MKRVYVVSNGGHDYSGAERFGGIVFCTEGSVNKWDVAQMYRELDDALLEAHAEDYILLSSLTTLCSIATAIMANRFGEVHFLLYKDNQYIEKHLILDNTNNE